MVEAVAAAPAATGTVTRVPAGKTPPDHSLDRFIAMMSSRSVSSPRSTASESGVSRPVVTIVVVVGSDGALSVGSAGAVAGGSSGWSRCASGGAAAMPALDQVDTVAAVVTEPRSAMRTSRCRTRFRRSASRATHRVGRSIGAERARMMAKTSEATWIIAQIQITTNRQRRSAWWCRWSVGRRRPGCAASPSRATVDR